MEKIEVRDFCDFCDGTGEIEGKDESKTPCPRNHESSGIPLFISRWVPVSEISLIISAEKLKRPH